MPRRAEPFRTIEDGEASSYLRSKRPVQVRGGASRWKRMILRCVLITLAVTGLTMAAARSVNHYLHTGQPFVFASDFSGLRLSGLRHVAPGAIERIFEPDRGAQLGEIPLQVRHRGLLEIPWVRDARILRVWPNRLWVHIEERRPAAFVRIQGRAGSTVETLLLVDYAGTFLEPPAGTRFSLPVVTGLHEGMPIEERQLRLKLLARLVSDLDREDPLYSARLSEVDISDPKNARATVAHGGEIIELQFGDQHFRHRYQIFLKYVQSWKEQYGSLRSVDLRFEGQVALRRSAS